jgi:hypothetical protein
MNGNRQISQKSARLLWAAGALVSWLMFVLLLKVDAGRNNVFSGVMCSPPVLALTFFAFGGKVPARFARWGLHPWGIITLALGLSILTAILLIQVGMRW